MKKGIDSGRLAEYVDHQTLKDSYRDFLINLLEKPMKNYSKEFFAEKTPLNIKYFTHLHELFPRAKLLHIVRNPFDVVASFLNVGKRKENLAAHYYSVREGAIFWRQMVNWITRFETSKEDAFQSQYKLIKYENILKQPNDVIVDLSEWIGIEYESDMLMLNEKEGTPAAFGNIFYTEEEYYKNFDSNNIDAFKKQLSEDEITAIFNETKNELIKLKYLSRDEVKNLPISEFSFQ